MKLLIFCPSLSLGKGGAENIATQLAFEMLERGHQIFIGYRCNRKAPAYTQHKDAILLPLDAEKPLHFYRNRLKKLRLDAIFLFYYSRDLLFYTDLLLIENTPFGIQECTNPERITSNNWENKTDRKGLPYWERELVSSSATRIRMVMPGYELSFPPYIRQNVRAFPNSAPATNNYTKPKEDNKYKKRIVIIGGLKPNKNITLLIKAFSLLDDISSWEIHDYGTNLDPKKVYHNQVSLLINSLNLTNKIFFHGPVDNILEEFSHAHIHVIASMSEGCPTAVLEAMAHGLPSIGIRSCHGTNILVKDRINGFLVDADSKGKHLATALSKLISNALLRKELGKQAYLDSKSYQGKNTYDQWEKLFKDMCSYINKPNSLFDEQLNADRERAMHMRRCKYNIPKI